MSKPYVFCHMLISLDGKIMGSYMDTPVGEVAADVFYNLAFGKNPYYKHQGWMCGRITTDDNFTFYREPVINKAAPAVPSGDFVAIKDACKYYFSIDPSGKLGWETNEITYVDTTAHVVEILTGKARNEYKSFLRNLNISYIIAGQDSIDYALAMEKIKILFGVETMMLGGGGVLNWSFLQTGICEELSVVIAPVADGSSETPTLFETRGNLAADNPIGFSLVDTKVMDGGSVWLRYKVNGATNS